MATSNYNKQVGTWPISPIYRNVNGRRQNPITSDPQPYQGTHRFKWLSSYQGEIYPDLPSAIPSRTNSALELTKQGASDYVPQAQWNLRPWPVLTKVDGKAYSKFLSPITDQDIDLGVYFGEMGETFDMIADRAKTLLGAYKAFKKGQVRRGLKILGAPAPRKGSRLPTWRDASKDTGALWLEYWFGWAPLVNDIYKGCELLSKGLLKKKSLKGVSGQNFVASCDYGTIEVNLMKVTEIATVRYICKYQAEVEVVNPNLHLAQRLGLTNPAAVVWELIPFSFLIDWFVNVGDVVGSWDPVMGVSFQRAFVTRYLQASVSHKRETLGNKVPHLGIYQMSEVTHEYFMCQRTLGVTPPKVRLRLDWPSLSQTRAATSISLLVQGLSSR